ncbi:MAG: hypothetical protein ABJA60_06095 [Nitrosospira sp.]
MTKLPVSVHVRITQKNWDRSGSAKVIAAAINPENWKAYKMVYRCRHIPDSNVIADREVPIEIKLSEARFLSLFIIDAICLALRLIKFGHYQAAKIPFNNGLGRYLAQLHLTSHENVVPALVCYECLRLTRPIARTAKPKATRKIDSGSGIDAGLAF